MLSMLGGQGMGSAGMGVGASPMMPGGGAGSLSPQMLAMLMQHMQQGGGTGQVTPQPGPFQAPPTGTPMAGYIGPSGNPGAMRPMQGAPAGQPPGMNNGQGAPGAAAGAAAGGGAMSPQMLQMLQMMKGQQGGVPAASSVGAANPVWNPNNPVGTSTLGGTTANQGDALANYAAAGGNGLSTTAPQSGGLMNWLSGLFSSGAAS